jgi:hypothetical protein
MAQPCMAAMVARLGLGTPRQLRGLAAAAVCLRRSLLGFAESLWIDVAEFLHLDY